MTALGLLPHLALFLAWSAITDHRGERAESLLLAFLGWGVWIVAVTELLSLFSLLQRGWILVAWSVPCVVLLGGLLRTSNGDGWSALRAYRPDGGTERVLAGGILAICFSTLAIGLLAPTNTADSMSYHMPRIEHWLQNGSVRHHDTPLLRQIFMPPFAEYAILHTRSLSGGDVLANSVQWLSMVGSLVSVGLVGRELGLSERARWMGVAFAATLPVGILQATTTQTDYVTTLWVVTAVYFALRHINHGPDRLPWEFAAALGLALLTKPSSYMFLAPFCVWWFVELVRRPRVHPRFVAASIAVPLTVAVLLNAGYLGRNLAHYQHPFGPPDRLAEESNHRFGPRVLISNLVRNATNHLGSDPDVDERVERAVREFHDAIGVSPDDPAISNERYGMHHLSTLEDRVGNAIHLVVILASLPLFLLLRRLRDDRRLLIYMSCLVAGILLFAGYLQWDPFRQRLHLPLFVMGGLLPAALFDGGDKPRLIGRIGALGLMAAAVPWVVSMEARPVAPIPLLATGPSIIGQDRTSLYFQVRPQELEEEFIRVADLIASSDCRRIGVVVDRGDWEYPLWVLLHQRLDDFRIRVFDRIPDPDPTCIHVYLRKTHFKANLIQQLEPGAPRLFDGTYLAATIP